MKRSVLFTAVSAVHSMLEHGINNPALMDASNAFLDAATALNAPSKTTKAAGNAPSQVSKKKTASKDTASPAKKKATTAAATKNTKSKEEVTPEVVKKAVTFVRSETRCGPTLLGKHLGISAAKAKRLLDKIKKEGLLDLPLEDLLKELPGGDDLLLPSHFKTLIAVDKTRRAKYLTGLDITKLLTAQRVAAAAKTGADLTLVNEVIALASAGSVPVENAMADFGTAEETIQYANAVGSWVSFLNDHFGDKTGEELSNFMFQNGISKAVLKDLQTIKNAARAGEI